MRETGERGFAWLRAKLSSHKESKGGRLTGHMWRKKGGESARELRIY